MVQHTQSEMNLAMQAVTELATNASATTLPTAKYFVSANVPTARSGIKNRRASSPFLNNGRR